MYESGFFFSWAKCLRSIYRKALHSLLLQVYTFTLSICWLIEQGTVGGDCSWCGSYWACRCLLCTDTIAKLISVCWYTFAGCTNLNFFRLIVIPNSYRSCTRKQHQVLCLATVKNEDKLEFSKILEAIKVKRQKLQSCMNCIFTLWAFTPFLDDSTSSCRLISMINLMRSGRNGVVGSWDPNPRPKQRPGKRCIPSEDGAELDLLSVLLLDEKLPWAYFFDFITNY